MSATWADRLTSFLGATVQPQEIEPGSDVWSVPASAFEFLFMNANESTQQCGPLDEQTRSEVTASGTLDDVRTVTCHCDVLTKFGVLIEALCKGRGFAVTVDATRFAVGAPAGTRDASAYTFVCDEDGRRLRCIQPNPQGDAEADTTAYTYALQQLSAFYSTLAHGRLMFTGVPSNRYNTVDSPLLSET